MKCHFPASWIEPESTEGHKPAAPRPPMVSAAQDTGNLLLVILIFFIFYFFFHPPFAVFSRRDVPGVALHLGAHKAAGVVPASSQLRFCRDGGSAVRPSSGSCRVLLLQRSPVPQHRPAAPQHTPGSATSIISSCWQNTRALCC